MLLNNLQIHFTKVSNQNLTEKKNLLGYNVINNELMFKFLTNYINIYYPKIKKKIPLLRGRVEGERSIIAKRKWESIGIRIQELVQRMMILMMIVWWATEFFWCINQMFLENSQHYILKDRQKKYEDFLMKWKGLYCGCLRVCMCDGYL